MKFKSLLILFVATTIFAQNNFIDSLVQSGIRDKIFPGASILIGNGSQILYKNVYGNFTYDPSSPKVESNSLFDLASVTKVIATTSCIMKLVDDNKLSIEDKVEKYIPEFASQDKGNVKIKNLLLHNSCMPAYYTPKSDQSREEILQAIFNQSPAYETGEEMVYSCLNFVTLMVIVEKITGMTMADYFQENFIIPLGLTNTMFIPPTNLIKNCVPTSDSLQGIVHDPLARGLRGLSGNAGLFSTAEDLSKFCIMLLKNGIYNGKQILKEETVKLFTQRDSDLSTRALGWDTRENNGYTSSGKYFSSTSFGHTGYTGTSIWIDPVKKLYGILLTNRVYPDDTAELTEFRPNFYEALMKSYGSK